MAAPATEARLVRGGVATGKTERLVEHVAELLAQGVLPGDVLVVCATPAAAGLFSRRLARACEAAGPGADAARGVEAVSARELELDVLAHPAARAHTGRNPRVLLPFEVSLLLEDLKVGGTPAGRLRGMLKFFYRSMTELADEADDFLVDADEIDAMERIKTLLAMSGGVLEYELPELACQCVRDVPEVAAAFARPYVVVDDYQLLCRASQLLCAELAGTSLWVAADPACSIEVLDPYPYAAGVDELVERVPQTIVEDLGESHACTGACFAASALRTDPELGEGPLKPAAGVADAPVEVAHGATPSEELGLVVEAVERALDGDAADGEVFVAVPNRTWEHNARRALGTRGVEALCRDDVRAATGGDIRELDRCTGARMLTLLLLAGDPTDGVAWRSWCGFGDYLANSGIVNALRDYADRTGAGTVEALDALERGDEAFADAGFAEERRRVVEAYTVGKGLVERVRGLTGERLLRAVADAVEGPDARVPDALARLCAPCGACDAVELRNRALHRAVLPGLGTLPREGAGASSRGRVVVAPLEDLAGRSPRVVVACGMVNGFLPDHAFFDSTRTPPGKVGKARAKMLRRAGVLFGKARERLVCTYFTQIGLVAAGSLDLKVDRIWTDGGTRMATVSPSIALEAAGVAPDAERQ